MSITNLSEKIFIVLLRSCMFRSNSKLTLGQLQKYVEQILRSFVTLMNYSDLSPFSSSDRLE